MSIEIREITELGPFNITDKVVWMNLEDGNCLDYLLILVNYTLYFETLIEARIV